MASNVKNRLYEFRRVLAKGTIRGKKISSSTPFLHFEAKSDMHFCKKFIKFWRKANEFEDFNPKRHHFVFTKTKSDAIVLHQKARQEGINVSTLVDMDHDVENRDLMEIEQIHSTKPACTLITIQFLQGETDVNESYLIEVIREFGDFNEQACKRIKKRTHQMTSERFEKAVFMQKNGSNKDVWEKLAWIKKKNPYPINDHALARSIAVEQGHEKYQKSDTPHDQIIWDIEDKIKLKALNDPNNKLRQLLSKMLREHGEINRPE